jgi:hypothetical protein
VAPFFESDLKVDKTIEWGGAGGGERNRPRKNKKKVRKYEKSKKIIRMN